MFAEKCAKRFGGDGSGIFKTLCDPAVHIAQQTFLFVGLNALADNLDADRVGENYQAADDGAAHVVVRALQEKVTIQLQHVDWDLVKDAEGRVPDPEVVDGDPEAVGTEPLDIAGDVLDFSMATLSVISSSKRPAGSR